MTVLFYLQINVYIKSKKHTSAECAFVLIFFVLNYFGYVTIQYSAKFIQRVRRNILISSEFRNCF